MKISEMIKNLQEFMNEIGDIECWYAMDDEGNGYCRVYNKPSLYYVNECDDVRHPSDIEYTHQEYKENFKEICVVN